MLCIRTCKVQAQRVPHAHTSHTNISYVCETHLGQLLGNVSSHKYSLQVDPEVLYLHPRLKDFCGVGELGDPVLDTLLEGGIVPGVHAEGTVAVSPTATGQGFKHTCRTVAVQPAITKTMMEMANLHMVKRQSLWSLPSITLHCSEGMQAWHSSAHHKAAEQTIPDKNTF